MLLLFCRVQNKANYGSFSVQFELTDLVFSALYHTERRDGYAIYFDAAIIARQMHKTVKLNLPDLGDKTEGYHNKIEDVPHPCK